MKDMLRIKDMLEIRTCVFRSDEGILLILLLNRATGRQAYIESGPGDRVDDFFMYDPLSPTPNNAEYKFEHRQKEIRGLAGETFVEDSKTQFADLANEREIEDFKDALTTWFVDDENEHKISNRIFSWVAEGVEPLEVVKSDKYALKTTEHQLGEW